MLQIQMLFNDTVVLGFRDLVFSVLPPFRARKAGNSTVPIGFSDHPPSEGSRSLNPARPLKPESGYSNQVVLKSRVWV